MNFSTRWGFNFRQDSRSRIGHLVLCKKAWNLRNIQQAQVGQQCALMTLLLIALNFMDCHMFVAVFLQLHS